MLTAISSLVTMHFRRPCLVLQTMDADISLLSMAKSPARAVTLRPQDQYHWPRVAAPCLPLPAVKITPWKFIASGRCITCNDETGPGVNLASMAQPETGLRHQISNSKRFICVPSARRCLVPELHLMDLSQSSEPSVCCQDFGLQVHLLCDVEHCSNVLKEAADTFQDWRAFLCLHCDVPPSGESFPLFKPLSSKSLKASLTDDLINSLYQCKIRQLLALTSI